ncbi:MAG: gamma-glutamyl-gamma-aminobutyrate hydrolase family protein [Rhodospirillales bacterium]|nr:MAG: gamma-glutamyl-gamma-aminobutyrate hydrolase family protein [Rhodospirillales bacterium]
MIASVPASGSASSAPRKIAIVVHQDQSRAGRVGALLEAKGYALERYCPNLGCQLPDDPSRFAGVVVFGGPMSANDCGVSDGIRRELAWIPKVLDSGVPFLGICLGAQMLTRVVGGRVAPHREGRVEIGYARVEPTAAGAPWFPDGPMHVYQWHREGMDVPSCCETLATGETYPVQAFRFGRAAFGVQFHPEVTLEMKRIWTTKAADRLTLPGAQPGDEHIGRHDEFDPQLGRWTDRFLDGWLATGRAVEAPSPRLAAE